MKLRRSLSVLAVFLMMNGSLPGSEPEKLLQVRWGELGKLIGGKKAALQLAEGARVEGRVTKVEATSLTIRVKKTSNPAAYPKGTMQIPSDAVSRIEVRGAAKRLKQTALTIVAALGAFMGGALIVDAVGPDGGRGKDLWVLEGPEIGAGIAIGAFVAVLMNLPRGSRDVTLIEIIPDSPGEREPKPANKDSGTSPIDSGAALPPLVEPSGPEQIRLQARRTLMRKDIPLRRYLPGEPRPALAAGPGR